MEPALLLFYMSVSSIFNNCQCNTILKKFSWKRYELFHLLIHWLKHLFELLLYVTNCAKYQVLWWPNVAYKTTRHQIKSEFQINQTYFSIACPTFETYIFTDIVFKYLRYTHAFYTFHIWTDLYSNITHFDLKLKFYWIYVMYMKEAEPLSSWTLSLALRSGGRQVDR